MSSGRLFSAKSLGFGAFNAFCLDTSKWHRLGFAVVSINAGSAFHPPSHFDLQAPQEKMGFLFLVSRARLAPSCATASALSLCFV